MPGPAKTPEEIVETLLDRAIPNGKCLECHLSPSMSRPGYYRHYVQVGGRGGKRVRVTRLVYEVINGGIDPNLGVLHTCDNPLCINPEHLWLGTCQDNTDDMISKGRKVDDPTVGLRRRKYTGVSIKRLLDQGLDRFQIADRLGISPSTVWNYINEPYKESL